MPLALPLRHVLHGQYLVGRVLGKPGGSGITYLGFDLLLHTRVAIKEYLPRDFASRDAGATTVRSHSEDDEGAFQAGLTHFLKEARTLARFDHPNVVRVRTFFEENGTACLVMDYYEGLSLLEYVKQQGGKIDGRVAVDIMVPVLDGLADVHAKGFLHRDIKPANIYLTTSRRPILLDFGAAKQATSDRSSTLSFLTPGFAPWEQYQQGGVRAPSADIYSAGATLYYMISGHMPPDAPQRSMGQRLEPLIECAPDVDHSVSDAVAWAMEMQPGDRPQSVSEFQDVLLGAKSAPSSRVRGVTPAQRKRVAPAARASHAAHPKVEAVKVSPESASATALGLRKEFTAMVFTADGILLEAAKVTWSSTDPLVATVDPQGLVTATGPGQTSIVAQQAGVTGSARVTVEQLPARIAVSPTRLRGKAGSTKTLRAEVFDANGNTIPGQVTDWRSSGPEIVEVDSAGTARFRKPGRATITAISAGARASIEAEIRQTRSIPWRVPVGVAAASVFVGGVYAAWNWMQEVRSPASTAVIGGFPDSSSVENADTLKSTPGSTIDTGMRAQSGDPDTPKSTPGLRIDTAMRRDSGGPVREFGKGSGTQKPPREPGSTNVEPVPSVTKVARDTAEPTIPPSTTGRSAPIAPTAAPPKVDVATQSAGTVPAAPSSTTAAPPPSGGASMGRNIRAEIRDAVRGCIETLRSRNAARMEQLYAPSVTPDPATRGKLLQLMRGSRLSIVGMPVVEAPEIDGGSGRAYFKVLLTWRTRFGGSDSWVRFRVTIVPDGDQSQIACGIVGDAGF